MNGEYNEVKVLLQKADDDFETAKTMFRRKKKIYWIICFPCQQAAEKYLKALLVHNDIEPERTHDLIKLSKQLKKRYPEISFYDTYCVYLNQYAVQVRYSDELELSTRDAKQALTAASELIEFVLGKINFNKRLK